MENRKKILWVVHEGSHSGANRASIEFAQVLKKHHHTVDWILPAQGEFLEQLQRKGFRANIIGFYNWTVSIRHKTPWNQQLKKMVRNVLSLWHFIRYLRRNYYQSAITNTVCFSVLAIACKLTGTKHIWLIHEFGEEDHGIKPWLGNKGYVLMAWLSEKVIVNSHAVKQKFLKFIPENKIIVQPNYITFDAPQHRDKRNRTPVMKLLMLGQVAPGKNHVDAIEAIRILQSKIGLCLSIYGTITDQLYYEKLIALIEEYKLTNAVVLQGKTNNPYSVIREHDLFLMCSKSEAYGRVTFEALSAGVPVIGFNGGATPDLITPGYNGYLYSNTRDLVDVLLNLYHSDDLRILTKNAKQSIIKIKNEKPGYAEQDVLNSFKV